MSTRAEHYRMAESALATVSARVRRGEGPGPGGEGVALVALAHATLAAAGPGVELEAAHGGPVVGGTREEPTVFGLTLDQVAERLDRLVALEGGRA
jgi:hypothetical protein